MPSPNPVQPQTDRSKLVLRTKLNLVLVTTLSLSCSVVSSPLKKMPTSRLPETRLRVRLTALPLECLALGHVVHRRPEIPYFQ